MQNIIEYSQVYRYIIKSEICTKKYLANEKYTVLSRTFPRKNLCFKMKTLNFKGTNVRVVKTNF